MCTGIIAFALLFPLHANSLALEEDTITFSIQEVSFMISGTSNVRDWEIETDAMKGTITGGPAFSDPEAYMEHPEAWFNQVELTISNKTLDSGISAMNSTMHQTLNSEEHPQLTYVLDEVEYVWGDAEPMELTFLVHGTATAAGNEHRFSEEIIIKKLGENRYEVSSEMKLNMTDFDIEPPTFMRGALQTGDAMNIAFRIVLTSE
ncbi:YceI family protein [Balneolaceae bacterium ANBcel3]|nr:YceI family protein [Balneolaceae bacterium ANBcel3]